MRILARCALLSTLGLWSCSGGKPAEGASEDSLSAIPAPVPHPTGGVYPLWIAGSSPTDIWATYNTPKKDYPGWTPAIAVWHFDGAGWTNVQLPDVPLLASDADKAATTITSAGPDAVWGFFTGGQFPKPYVARITPDGKTEDHTSEIASDAGTADTLVGVHVSPQSGIYLDVTTPEGPPSSPPVAHRLYHEVAGHFVLLMELPVGASATVVLSDDEIWVHDRKIPTVAGEQPKPDTYQRLVAGQWQPFSQPLGMTTLLGAVGTAIGSPTDVWTGGGDASVDLGSSGNGPQQPGSVEHFDGSSISTQALTAPNVNAPDEFNARYGILSVAPGVVALLSRHVGSVQNIESQRWDGSTLGAPHVIVHNVKFCMGCAGDGLPILARLLDGTVVHGRSLASTNEVQLVLGHNADY